jgi:hypothetical protein
MGSRLLDQRTGRLERRIAATDQKGRQFSCRRSAGIGVVGHLSLIGYHAAARSSLSAPRATIRSALSGNGRCNALASSHRAHHGLRMYRRNYVVRDTSPGQLHHWDHCRSVAPRMGVPDGRLRRAQLQFSQAFRYQIANTVSLPVAASLSVKL